MSSTIQTDPPLLRMTLTPPFGVSEASKAVLHALAAADADRPLDLLIVARGNQNTPAAEMRRLAEALGELDRPFGRRVAVAADSDLSYGLFRMFGVFAGTAGVDVAVFRCAQEAERWLREGPSPGLPAGAELGRTAGHKS